MDQRYKSTLLTLKRTARSLCKARSMEGFARPDFGDETVDEIVIVSLYKFGFCRLRLM
jgi:hypothetical protein